MRRLFPTVVFVRVASLASLRSKIIRGCRISRRSGTRRTLLLRRRSRRSAGTRLRLRPATCPNAQKSKYKKRSQDSQNPSSRKTVLQADGRQAAQLHPILTPNSSTSRALVPAVSAIHHLHRHARTSSKSSLAAGSSECGCHEDISSKIV